MHEKDAPIDRQVADKVNSEWTNLFYNLIKTCYSNILFNFKVR